MGSRKMLSTGPKLKEIDLAVHETYEALEDYEEIELH